MANVIDEILITGECEDNVIVIESDASTMTSNMVSNTGTKRKRNYFIKIPESKSTLLLNKKQRKSDILELTSEQSIGNKSNSVFNSDLTALYAKRLKSTNLFTAVHPELLVSDCELVRSGQDGRCILGVWKGDQYNAILYKIALNLSQRGGYEEENNFSFLESIEHIGPFFSKTCITDICDTNVRNQNYVLYAGNYSNEDWLKKSSAVLCNFTNSPSSTGNQYVSARNVLCCCGSRNGDVFATGSDEGFNVYKEHEIVFHDRYIGRVNSVEFDSTGNILYCGTDSSKIIILDRRERPWDNCKIEMIDWSSGISETKLFSNEKTMVVSSFDGSLTQIDLRTGKSVVNYPGHVCNEKIPFSFSERANLLCATGTDKLTRLWSLCTGSYLCAIGPQIASNKVQSCLVSDGSRWFVAIFQNNKMFVVESQN